MKALFLTLTLALLSSSVLAQYELRLNQEEITTDQPGLIFRVTKDTLPQTVIHFTQIFKCAAYENERCIQVAKGTKFRDVSIRFEDPTDEIKGEMFTFNIEFDASMKLFRTNLRAFNSRYSYRVTREDAGVTVILTVKRSDEITQH